MYRDHLKMASAALIGLSLSSAAFGQVLGQKTADERVGLSVEVKPIPTVLSVVPGVGAATIGVEGDTNRALNQTVYGEVTAFNTNLPERFEEDYREEASDKLYPNKLRGGGIDIGTRFYSSLSTHGYYTGVKVGYNEITGEWKYKDEVVDSRLAQITPGIAAGYRWLWDSSVMVRLGANLSANLIQDNSVDNDVQVNAQDAETAADDVEDAQRQPVLAGVDLGLGYKF